VNEEFGLPLRWLCAARRSSLSARRQIRVCLVALLYAFAAWAHARTIPADTYEDKLHAMWVGQLLGNYAGRGVYPGTDVEKEGYCPRGGATFESIGWGDALATDIWVADDDTALEYMYLDLLRTSPTPSAAQLKQTWTDNFALGDLYVANMQARYLMEPAPLGGDLVPPETGDFRRNMHWYAIDAQIATESAGALAPGMRQSAVDLCGQLSEVTNDGYPVHAAQFYASMYASAAMDEELAGITHAEKVESLVARGLEVVPQTSRTREVVQLVQDRYDADKAAGVLGDPDAWRQTQTMLYDQYGSTLGSNNRYRFWIESTVNTGLTTMALLYGQGDFQRTVEIGVRGGFDADCNPATAAGLLGMLKGYQGANGLVQELGVTPSDAYNVTCLQSAGKMTTISQVASDFRDAFEVRADGAGVTISHEEGATVYVLPPTDTVVPPAELPDPAGPIGLVAEVLAAGGEVTVSAAVEYHTPTNDRRNLDAIIDGITDVRFNGHLPYWSDDGENPQPEGGDWYSLEFDRIAEFEKIVFHEGDLSWLRINSNPRTDPPKGGWFEDLTVEVGRNGEFAEVANLTLSEELDPYKYFQIIELTFDPAVGDAIRIRGTAGGTREFTSIVELEAWGQILLPGDANTDGQVTDADYTLWADSYGISPASWKMGDFDGSGKVTDADYTLWADHYGLSGPGLVPEPGCVTLLVAVVGLSATRVRGTTRTPLRQERTRRAS
jgi:ADP-ribosylglycohydrolase